MIDLNKTAEDFWDARERQRTSGTRAASWQLIQPLLMAAIRLEVVRRERIGVLAVGFRGPSWSRPMPCLGRFGPRAISRTPPNLRAMRRDCHEVPFPLRLESQGKRVRLALLAMLTSSSTRTDC